MMLLLRSLDPRLEFILAAVQTADQYEINQALPTQRFFSSADCATAIGAQLQRMSIKRAVPELSCV